MIMPEYEVKKLDKNEYNLKLEEIDKYVNQGNYGEAAKVADQIDWRRVRNVRTLCMISEIYEADNRYEDSKELLQKAYRRSPVGRSILYRLVEVTIRLKQFDEAIEYYSEYVQAAPHDNSKYILKYKIYKGRGSSLDEQIDILKEYLDQEYNEKWAYELARLYQQAGKIQECLTACDDLVLWFHSGKYVIKALELKRRYAPLTPKQQEIYDRRFDDEENGEDIYPDETKLGREKQIVETNEDVLAESIMADTEKEIAQSVAETAQIQEEPEVSAAEPVGEEPEQQEFEPEPETEDEDMEQSGSGTGAEDITEPDHPVNPNLQEDLVRSMREIVSGVSRRPEPVEENEPEDQVIAQSKEEQEAAAAVREPGAGLQMPPKVQIPEENETAKAPQLSIDDILLSMGEKGNAMRQAAARMNQQAAHSAGVVSAVDEALINMGRNPEEQGQQPDAADEVTGQPASAYEEQSEPEPQEIAGEPEPQEAAPQMTAKETTEAPTEEEEDITLAKTRRMPVEEISRLRAAMSLNEDRPVRRYDAAPTPQQPERREPVQTAPAAEPFEKEPQEMRPVAEEPAAAPQSEAPRREEPQFGAPQQEMEADYGQYTRPGYQRQMLREDQRGFFEGFLNIQNLEEQIASAIIQAEQKGEDRTSRTGNVLIFGDHGCGKTTIAMGIAKAVAQDRGSQYLKMARIYATDLNRKDIAATIAKIAGGVLIIEEAGDLEDAIVDQLTTAMEFRTDGMIMILEDEQRYIHDLLMRHPRFTMKFTSQIFIPTFTIDELVHFGEIYAGQQDYVFSDSAAGALYERIGSVAAQGDAVSITNVIELVDRAINKSNKFFRKLGAGKKRYDENDCVILQEKDFK